MLRLGLTRDQAAETYEDAVQPIFLSAIKYEHGEPRYLADLDEPAARELAAPEHGLVRYRASDQETWQLARLVAERTLARSAARPDLLIYVTDSDPDPAESLPRIVGELGQPGLAYVAVRGHGCGSLGPSLALAADALHSARRDRVLLVLADRVASGPRVMPSGLSVFSDGAASCLVTREDAATCGRRDKVIALATRNHAQAGEVGAAAGSLLTIAATAAAATTEVLGAAGRRVEDFRHVLFANYRVTSQQFLASAMGFPPEALLLGELGRFGHCFGADILVTLDTLAAAGRISPEDRLLASATGPSSWSVLAVEVGSDQGSLARKDR
jgi:3-oxoacyl-[acyl-carrier-protein] synthase III